MLDVGILTEEQAAQCLRLTVATMRNWRCQRRGPPPVKIGRKCFYREEAVLKWIAAREGASRSETPRPPQPQRRTRK